MSITTYLTHDKKNYEKSGVKKLQYNVKVLKYANDKQQIRFYQTPIKVNENIKKILKSDIYIKKETRYHEAADHAIDLNDEEIEFNKLHSVLNSKNRSVNAIYDIARANTWDWFVTFTFDPQRIDSTNYDMVMNEMAQFLKMLKKRHNDFKYLIVPELHSDKKKWHIHGLFANISDMYFLETGDKDDSGRSIFRMVNYRLGRNEHTKVDDNNKVIRYITKYITKELVMSTPNRHRYIASTNCNRPEVLTYKITNYEKFIKLIEDKIYWAKTVDYLDTSMVYIEIEDYENDLYLFERV